jgi:hypothetical protein
VIHVNYIFITKSVSNIYLDFVIIRILELIYAIVTSVIVTSVMVMTPQLFVDVMK